MESARLDPIEFGSHMDAKEPKEWLSQVGKFNPMLSVPAGTRGLIMLLTEAYRTLYRRWAVELSEASETRHRFDLRRFCALMGETSIYEIKTQTYQEFRVKSAKVGHSAATTEQTLRTVRQTLNAAASLGILESVPYIGRARKIHRKMPQPPTPAELKRLFWSAIAMRWPRRTPWGKPATFWRSWMGLAYWTALRPTDVRMRLSKSHIDGQAIWFQAHKTSLQHCWPMTENVWRIVNNWRGEPDQPFFNVTNSDNCFRAYLRELCEHAEVRKLTPQQFRAAGITQWAKASSTAGGIIHGSSLPSVMNRYLDPLEVLTEAAPRVLWPFDSEMPFV